MTNFAKMSVVFLHKNLPVSEHYGCKAPTFMRTPNGVVVKKGSPILLRCTVHDLEPNTQVEWFFRAKQGSSLSFSRLEPSERSAKVSKQAHVELCLRIFTALEDIKVLKVL